ncbi:MAG: kynureninase [Phycisphaerales bacterium]
MTTHDFQTGEAFARSLDAADSLAGYRAQFAIPTMGAIAGIDAGAAARSGAGEACIYLTGNSLGCMPRAARDAVTQELDDWERLGVEGHLHGRHPWLPYHEFMRQTGARLVGALPHEVVMMNSLTVNLHLLMVSFYRPTRERFKIVIEDSAFPSDSYAVASQAAFHGLDPARAIVRLKPREGEHTLRDDDILSVIDREGASIALVMLGGVNYLTGQWFRMERITGAARAKGCVVGWDLAHAAGNVPLRLHDWGVDFAAWCSYKYLNAGPGAIAGAFVHERHTRVAPAASMPRFAGWWGNDPATRFKMGPTFEPVASADAWQLSNPPILSLAPLRVSLEIFDRAGMAALRVKAERLTGYLEWLLVGEGARGGETMRGKGTGFEIITPTEPERRGCALSIAIRPAGGGSVNGKEFTAKLRSRGVVCDFREPNVIRAAPVPLYNTFMDVWRFAKVLREVCDG